MSTNLVHHVLTNANISDFQRFLVTWLVLLVVCLMLSWLVLRLSLYISNIWRTSSQHKSFIIFLLLSFSFNKNPETCYWQLQLTKPLHTTPLLPFHRCCHSQLKLWIHFRHQFLCKMFHAISTVPRVSDFTERYFCISSSSSLSTSFFICVGLSCHFFAKVL